MLIGKEADKLELTLVFKLQVLVPIFKKDILN